MRKLILFSLTIFFSLQIFSQTSNAINHGSVSGKIYDSVKHYILKSATVAVYLDSTKPTLLKYTLTDEFGEFFLDNLPLNSRLKIIISYAGYLMHSETVVLTITNRTTAFGKIYLFEEQVDLGNVTVTYIPPVRYNKDTLEFNADAFKLEKGTVLQDLLKKLPGVILWGDGTITVNGRNVNNILVDGKPFLGGNMKVATNNIPNEIIDKVQVYQQSDNENAATDSITQVNVKLKKDRNGGFFGKSSVELGNGNYDLSNTSHFFSPKTQVSVIGAKNNVNRISNSVKTIVENSLFKNGNVSFDYQPDFRLPGISKTTEYGMLFQNELRHQKAIDDFARMNAEYYGGKLNTNTTSSSESIYRIPNLELKQRSILLENKNSVKNAISIKIENARPKRNVLSEVKFERLSSVNSANETDSVFENISSFRSANKNVSTGLKENVSLDISNRYLTLTISGRKVLVVNKFLLAWNNNNTDFSNNLTLTNGQQNIKRLSDFNSFSYKFISNIEFENFNISPITKIDFGTQILSSQVHEDGVVAKYDSLTRKYVDILGLTHKSRFGQIEMSPYAKLRIQFDRGLTNRYFKSTQYYFNLRGIFFAQSGNSNLDNLRFRNEIMRPNPEIGFRYTNFRTALWLKILNIKYSSMPIRLTRSNFVNLIDSVNIYENNYGNRLLKTPIRNQLEIDFSRMPIGRTMSIKYEVKLNASIIARNISDSIIQKNNGQRDYFVINGNRAYSFSVYSNASKMIYSGKNNFQLIFNSASVFNKTPGSINTASITTESWSHLIRGELYSYLGKSISANVGYSFLFNSLEQYGVGLTHKIYNKLTSIRFGVNYNTKANTQVNSSIFYNKNNATVQSGNPAFIIWNLKISQRFFKTKNTEISFNAYDLFKSNRNISYSTNKNGIVLISQNVLQQYFSFSLSYYPRIFKRTNDE